MTRKLLQVGVCMLIGAVLTVAVAWACAIRCRTKDYSITYDPPPPGSRLSSASRVPEGWEKGTHVRYWSRGLRYELVTEMVWMGSRLAMMMGRNNRSVERVEVGWPLATMEWIGEMDYRHTRDGWNWRHGLTPTHEYDQVVALGARARLPLVPLWPGFAVTMLAWGAVCWCVLMGGLALRAARRRRHGLCVACGYEVRSLDVCPECGRRNSGLGRRG